MDYIIDATNQKLGRLASHIATVLQGKLHPGYEPRAPGVDRVIVRNASRLVVTGRKYTEKIYYRHTGYMGHLREKRYREVFERSPAAVLRRAVEHMLPKNRLSRARMRRLIIHDRES